MSKISTETRRELVKAIQDRYESASLLDKQQILDEFVALTGYHRKHAIHVLGSGSSTLDPVVRERLLAASAATIDRLLATRRATAGGRRRRPPARSAASRSIPIRTSGDWINLLAISAAPLEQLVGYLMGEPSPSTPSGRWQQENAFKHSAERWGDQPTRRPQGRALSSRHDHSQSRASPK